MKLKKIFKNRSKLLGTLIVIEGIIAIISILAFVYSDSLSYSDSLIYKSTGIEKLLETMYSSTWWAFILLLISLTVICSLVCFVYKKLEFQFMSISLITILLILSINIKNALLDNIANAAILIPIIIINIIAYNNQKQLLKKKK